MRGRSSAVDRSLFKFAISVNDDPCMISREGGNLSVCGAIFLPVFKVK